MKREKHQADDFTWALEQAAPEARILLSYKVTQDNKLKPSHLKQIHFQWVRMVFVTCKQRKILTVKL